MVYTAVFAVIAKFDRKKTVVFISALCLCIQLLDLRDILSDKHRIFTENKNYVSVLDNSFDEIAEGADEIVFLPLPENYISYREMYITFGEYASCHNMKMSSFYAARPDYDALSKYAENKYEKLMNGNGEENILYVFFSENEVPTENSYLHVYKVADYTVARYIPEN